MTNKLTRKDLLERLANKNGMHPVLARELINTIFTTIRDTLENGEDVTITGFGAFRVLSKKKRLGRNPATGKPIMICKRQTVSFKPGAGLKGVINKSQE